MTSCHPSFFNKALHKIRKEGTSIAVMVRKVRPSASSPGSVPETLRDGLPLPKLGEQIIPLHVLRLDSDNILPAVFDLDYTLWPFWADTHPTPPVKKHPNKPLTAIDRYKTDYTTYAPTLPL